MNRIVLLALLLPAAAAPLRAAPALEYREAQEQVIVDRQVYSYRADQRGFVAASGDWVGWDEQAGNWLLRRRDGGWSRFGEDGRLLQSSAPHRQPAPQGYNPATDIGDTPADAKMDPAPAWDYLKEQQTVLDARSAAAAGDDGGGAVEAGALGGDQVAREKKMRENWAQTPGAHASDPEAAMETGAVEDPVKKLMDTVRQARDAVDGVADTISEVDALRQQLEDPDGYVDSARSRPRRSGSGDSATGTTDDVSGAAVPSGMPPPAGSNAGTAPGMATGRAWSPAAPPMQESPRGEMVPSGAPQVMTRKDDFPIPQVFSDSFDGARTPHPSQADTFSRKRPLPTAVEHVPLEKTVPLKPVQYE